MGTVLLNISIHPHINLSMYKYMIDIDTSVLLYKSPEITTPFKRTTLKFADDTASGRPCVLIDKIIEKNVIPFYSNTHSNAACGEFMVEMIGKTRSIIREHFNLSNNHKILFTGTGATGAVNHLVNSIDVNNYEHVNVFISILEHHSNYLPWSKLSQHKNVNLYIIPLKDDMINLSLLDERLSASQGSSTLNIVSVTGCSNVTGIKTDIDTLSSIVHKHDRKCNFLLIDAATLAPHEEVKYDVDGIFISGHKFLGGTSTPGILIAHKDLFGTNCPYAPGGGCVIEADMDEIKYENDIEKKESGGTPNIVGIIRLYYQLKLFKKLKNVITGNDHIIAKYIYNKMNMFAKKYSNFSIILQDADITKRMPIVAFYISNVHYNLIVILLNDLFGIQTRGGISCCGMFGRYIFTRYNIGGWCRITFSWLMSQKEIDYILDAVEFVIQHGHRFEKYYEYDEHENMFHFKKGVDVSEVRDIVERL